MEPTIGKYITDKNISTFVSLFNKKHSAIIKVAYPGYTIISVSVEGKSVKGLKNLWTLFDQADHENLKLSLDKSIEMMQPLPVKGITLSESDIKVGITIEPLGEKPQNGLFIYLYKKTSSPDDEMLRKQEILESIPQMAWTARSDGYVDYYNKRWFEYTGQTEEEALGWGWSNVEHPTDLEMVREKLEHNLSKGNSLEMEIRYKRGSDDEYRWHLVRALPVKDNDDVIQYWIGTATDIHEQKEIEEKKDEFVSVASHELKTPLTAIQGYLELIEDSINDDDDIQHLSSKACQSALRMARLIDRLLSVSRLETKNILLQKEKVSLNELIKECSQGIKDGTKRIKIKGEITDVYFGDSESLFRVFSNLIENAIKYSPSNKKVEVVLYSNSEKVRIKIIDKGIGISEDKIDRLFDRYYRVKHSRNLTGGMGLGLYITKSLVELHGGTISVDSKEGKGTTMQVELPRIR